MPKKQIHVVSLTPFEKVEEDTPNEMTQNKEEDTPDDITQIREAIKEEEAEIVEAPVEAKPKPKRKAAAKKKNIIEEYSEQKEEPPQAIQPEPEPEIKEETQKKVKTLELVKCDKCNKEMTKRTLRYDHPKTCKGAPINREDIPVQKRVKPITPPKIIEQPMQISNDIIEQEIKKRIQSSIQEKMQMKLKQKEERIKKLAEKIA